MGDSKTVTEAAQCPEEKKPRGWVPLQPLFSKQGLSSLCSLSFYGCHKSLLFSLQLLTVLEQAGMQEMQGTLLKIFNNL